jgi:V/A-type H+-transporting ATPase subunit K
VEETIWGLTGPVWAFAGAAFAIIGGGIGSAIGLSSASNTASGIITEDADKFGRVLLLAAMPSTQGIYGFITALLVMILTGLLFGEAVPDLSAKAGFSIFLSCLPVAFLGAVTGAYQGLASAGAAGMVARRDEEAGRALIFPALVETYAVFALITTVLMLLSLQSMYGFGG